MPCRRVLHKPFFAVLPVVSHVQDRVEGLQECINFGFISSYLQLKNCQAWGYLVAVFAIQPATGFLMAFLICDARFWENHWIWWTAPFVGGISAGLIYKNLFMEK